MFKKRGKKAKGFNGQLQNPPDNYIIEVLEGSGMIPKA